MSVSPRRSLAVVVVLFLLGLAAPALDADVWPWKPASSGDVELLIIGDIQVQRRADPTSAFAHVRDTLTRADLVYANLEGMLVPSKGPVGDIPDKKWIHPGPEGVKALVAANVSAVGVANNVVWDEQNLLATMRVLDASGVKHVNSPGLPLPLDGQEAVLLGPAPGTSSQPQ